MENAKLKSSKVYAWVLVIALGLMSAGTTGSYSVIAGSFVAPVCEEFGFDYSIFSYYFTATLIGLAAALFLLQTVYLPQMGLSLRSCTRPANRSKRCFRVLRLSPAYTRVR